jgi:hypothetical protein
VLTIPEGVDPARVARDFRSTAVRTVRGGPAGFGREHREIGFGVTGRWQF